MTFEHIPNGTVDSIVTSPLSTQSDEVWRECFRVLKPGAHLIVFNTTKTHHKTTVSVEDAGFEIRDMIAWLHCGNLEGLSPDLDPITFARKPLGEKTVPKNVLKYGTGAINVDGCRVPAVGEKIETHSKSSAAAKSKGIFGDFGGVETGQSDSQKLGRFPANLIHDGSAQVLECFPGDNTTNTARFFYCVDENSTRPIGLLRYLFRLVTPPGGVVFDPFSHQSKTQEAAEAEGFTFMENT